QRLRQPERHPLRPSQWRRSRGSWRILLSHYARIRCFACALGTFSSAGPTPILFDTGGKRLVTPQIRLKPEIVAPDGTDTTFFGRDVDADRFPNFFGTSAAAPHAAAVAALMLQSAPTTAPETVYDILETTAIDMAPLDSTSTADSA